MRLNPTMMLAFEGAHISFRLIPPFSTAADLSEVANWGQQRSEHSSKETKTRLTHLHYLK